MAGWFSEPEVVQQVSQEDLPDDIPSLLEIAKREIERANSRTGLERAVGALEKSAKLLKEGKKSSPHEAVHAGDIDILLAEVCFLLCERESDSSVALFWIKKGEAAAERVIRLLPSRVEGYYYGAVLRGRHAELGGLGGIAQVRIVEKLGQRAVKIDPSFERGGPYRLLAMIYAKAPPWPTSVGDIDLALEYAEKAVEIVDYPLNTLIMAEVLIEADEPEEAAALLRRVLAAPKVGKWAQEGEHWRPHARQLLKRLGR